MSGSTRPALLLAATLSLACTFLSRFAEPAEPTPPEQSLPAAGGSPTAGSTPSASLATRMLYMPYFGGGHQVWQLGTGVPLQVDLPIEVGQFYGYSPATNRILYASAWADQGAGPDNMAVSDLVVFDLASGSSETLVEENVVEALWAPNGIDLAYILVTPDTYELHWRTGSGEDRTLASNVTFTWSIAPSGDAVAFTRETGYVLTRDPGLFVVRVKDAIETKVSDADPGGRGSISDQPVWSPDSAWVVLPAWSSSPPRLSFARADGSGAIDGALDPALQDEWWASTAIPSLLWDPNGSRLIAAPAVGKGEMGGPSPLVSFDLDLEHGMLRNGLLLAEIGFLIGWDVPGESVWVMSIDGRPERVHLP